MKREAGFTLVELLTAIAVMAVILAATVGALTSAVQTTQAVTMMADTQENLRAGMNYMIRDLIQAGEGIPQNGLTIPNSGGGTPTSNVNTPGPGATTFSTTWTSLPAVMPGFQTGPTTTTSGVATDTVTILYADSTLVNNNGTTVSWLNKYPINSTTNCPAGSITTVGTTTTVIFDPTCVNINTGNTAIHVGDLIMLQNNNTTTVDMSTAATNTSTTDSNGHVALLYVSSTNLAANQIQFLTGDPFNLNNSGQPVGTIAGIQSSTSPIAYGNPVTATRIWMVTYYINNANPQIPMLMRQVNMNAPQAVGEVIENLQVFYDILNPGASPPALLANGAGSTQWESIPAGDNPYIRDAYIILSARSDSLLMLSKQTQYFRNNLSTVVSMRGLDFYNKFQ